jgi:RNA polymerase II subunit A small phosphatase-like protein
MPTNSPQIRNLPTPQSPPKFSNFPNYNNGSQKLLNRNNSSPYLNANKSQNFTKRKTLILDLDETLVHSGFHPFNRKSDFTLNIKVDGKNHTIYVLKRPYVEEFLSEIAPYYEIIIFTASISEYASPLLDMLDKSKLTSGRLFRQHCLFNHGLYLKDIKIIQKDLKDVIIIDNNPVSYVMNQDNGLPILTWYDDLNDRELINFIPLLKYLSTEDDVREVIKKIVDKQTNKIKFEIVEELIKKKINEIINIKI